MASTLDHIAFTAASREAGVTAFNAASGITLPLGGEHPNMGTHNALSSLGPNTFLELITIDPTGTKPDRPRWFALDDLPDDAGLRAHTIILRSVDLDGDLEKARALGVDLGTPMALSRGDLSWRFAIRDDGTIPLSGTAPMLMQWDQADPHPASRMTEQGMRLKSIAVSTPDPDLLTALFDSLGWTDLQITKGAPKWAFALDVNGTEVTL